MKNSLLFFLALLLASAALAAPSDCPEHFLGGEAPELVNQRLATRTISLCFDAYAVMHSGVSRTPLWSAERLTAGRVKQSKTIKRRNAFHAERRLPTADRAELRDYARSGFDRGHMSPSGDMPTAYAQYESFSLANMVPQNADNNQNLWASIEESTRNLATYLGELYVITGPIFEGSSIERINGRVFVPTHVFKAIYDPKTHGAAAYVAPNTQGTEYQAVSIAELEKRIGLNLFPKMDVKIKQKRMRLPEPRPHGRKMR